MALGCRILKCTLILTLRTVFVAESVMNMHIFKSVPINVVTVETKARHCSEKSYLWAEENSTVLRFYIGVAYMINKEPPKANLELPPTHLSPLNRSHAQLPPTFNSIVFNSPSFGYMN